MRALRPIALPLVAHALAACGGARAPTSPGGPGGGSHAMPVTGHADVSTQYTSELAYRGGYVYTTTWGLRGTTYGNTVRAWNVSGDSLRLVSSQDIAGATTTGDVQVSDDGRLLMVATERRNGEVVLYDLADPGHPRQVGQLQNADTYPGVHTAKFGRVNGVLYGFLSIDPLGGTPARLVVADLGDPAQPREIWSRVMGNPYVHDVFVRDGILFTALWDDGLQLWDVGGAGRGGSPSSPVPMGRVQTVGGEVHNVWWLHDPATGSRRFALVGEEGPGEIGQSSVGDIHVVDVSDMDQPHEVAFYHVANAGTHNFSVDEARGILYAAYYNAGVRALDVRGDLAGCTAAQKAADGRCDLTLMKRELAAGLTDEGSVYVWGVAWDGAGSVYASDMLNGLWRLRAVAR